MSTPTLTSSNAALAKLFKGISAHEAGFLVASRGAMRPLVAPLLSQLDLTEKTTEPFALLDAACGTGVLTQEVQARVPGDVLEKSSVLCADLSGEMVGIVERRVEGEGWVNVRTAVLDAKDTGLPDNSFSHVGIGLGLHLIPGPDAVLAEGKRILKPGGIFSATTFHKDSTFWIPDLRAAFASFPYPAPFPATIDMQRHADGDWTDPAWISAHLKEMGFTDVEVTLTRDRYRVKDVDEFVQTFSTMVAWVRNGWWDEETRGEHGEEEVREGVRRYLGERYGGEGWDVEFAVICMSGRA